MCYTHGYYKVTGTLIAPESVGMI